MLISQRVLIGSAGLRKNFMSAFFLLFGAGQGRSFRRIGNPPPCVPMIQIIMARLEREPRARRMHAAGRTPQVLNTRRRPIPSHLLL